MDIDAFLYFLFTSFFHFFTLEGSPSEGLLPMVFTRGGMACLHAPVFSGRVTSRDGMVDDTVGCGGRLVSSGLPTVTGYAFFTT